MNLRQLALAGIAVLALGGTAAAAVGQSMPTDQATPPPPPAPGGSVTTPAPGRAPTVAPAATASPAPAGRKGRKGATPEPSPGASESPEPLQFSSMDGVWEVQLQPLTGTGRTIYQHFYFVQKGDTLTGSWARSGSEKLNLSGTFDGRLFKLTAKDAKDATWTFSGYAENFSDMVGLLTTADPKDRGTPFTASHRKRERYQV